MVILSKEFIPTRSKNAQKSTPPKPSFDSSFLIHFSLIKPIYAIVHVFLCVRQNKEKLRCLNFSDFPALLKFHQIVKKNVKLKGDL